MEYNRHKVVDGAAAAGITWLDLERIEERYLLAACADGALWSILSCFSQI